MAVFDAVMEKGQKKFDEKLAQLRQERKAETDPSRQTFLDNRIKNMEKASPAKMLKALRKMFSAAIRNCFWFEAGASLCTYLVLLVAGIGMLKLRPWARKTAIFASILRLVANVIYAVLNFTIIIPQMSEGQQEYFEAIQSMPNAPSVPMTGMTGAPAYLGGVFNLVLYSALPVTIMILLHSKSAKQAFGLIPPDAAPPAPAPPPVQPLPPAAPPGPSSGS
jgi:hypothetical protein